MYVYSEYFLTLSFSVLTLNFHFTALSLEEQAFLLLIKLNISVISLSFVLFVWSKTSLPKVVMILYFVFFLEALHF